MAEEVLLIGHHTPLGKKIAELLLAEGSSVVRTVLPEEEAPQEEAGPSRETEEEEELLTSVLWNRSSPISTHNVILETYTQHEKLDRVLFIFDTTKDNRALHEIPLAEIEKYIDRRFKGLTFLLKELIQHYQRNRGLAEISLILHTEGAKVLPPLDGMGSGAFRSLGNSLFTFYQNEDITINGFESSSPDSGDYAEFILKTLREKAGKSHGKWFRFQDKSVWNSLGLQGKR
ncbi:MAG: hypothetical protein ACLFNZ_07685 [Spirochaetaceae bacterium]